MKRIAIIQDGFVRDAQIFAANPDIIGKDPNWEDNFRDIKSPCQYLGVFEGADEDDMRSKAADIEGVHPNVISLIEI